MRLLKPLLFALLVLAMLPWGAFAHAAPRLPQPPDATQAESTGGTVAPVPRCKGPALPGAVCALKISLTDETALPGAPESLTATGAAEALPGAGLAQPAQPLPPPRPL